MSQASDKFQTLFQEVEKPGRYVGGEVNSILKDPAQVKLHVALVFPDAYEMGESHVGLKVLYKILNDQPHIWAERVYAPWPDMEAALIRQQMPLFSLESRRPLHEFDLIGITLPYELVYTNILTILDQGGVPLWQKDRGEHHPIVVGGGTCAFNPEPVAEFFDAIVVGDGEDVILKIAEDVLQSKQAGGGREKLLKDLIRHEGVYVPSFFDVHYQEDGTVGSIEAKFPEYPGVIKATVGNLDQAAYPTAPVVPNIGVIHDRIGVEVQRGCVRGCRFCQAGYIYRPERQRSPDTVKNIIAESLKCTGQEEVSLLSLSVGDYEPLSPLLNELFDRYEKDRVAISLPATRTETLTPEIIKQIKRVRKTGFTIAPEAGTPRMRRLINKGNERADMMNTVENVFREGWRLIKFYYMCGLPLEQEADVLGIAEEAKMALAIGKRYSRAVKINVAVSSFVPKPFTPFQWEPQLTIAEVQRLHGLIKRELNVAGLKFKHHQTEMSYLEGVFSRGDRRLSRTLVRAYELGARFDEWEEQLDFPLWMRAFEETGIDPDFYVTRRRSREEVLPWDHLFIQMKKDFLWSEWEAAHDQAFVEDCSTHRCPDCGVCDFRKVKNINYRFEAEKGEIYAHSTRGRVLKDEPRQRLSSPDAFHSKEKGFETQIKFRVHYVKLGEAAYLSHLDLMTVLRRALARAAIPVGYSQGFHPQVLISMGPAQPLGQESEAEYLDIELVQTMDPREFQERMNRELPSGIAIRRVWDIPKNTPSLNGTLREQVYCIDLRLPAPAENDGDSLQEMVHRFQNTKEIPIERRRTHKSQTIDIRPLVKELSVVGPDQLHLVTRFAPTTGSVKPREVLQALLANRAMEIGVRRIRKVESVFVS